MSSIWNNTPDLDLPRTRLSRRKKKPVDAEGVPVVYYVKVHCPNCGSDDCPVYSSDDLPLFRRHRCKKCGETFKSIEKKM